MASVLPKPPSLKKENARQRALSIELRHSFVRRKYYTNSDADLSLACIREFKENNAPVDELFCFFFCCRGQQAHFLIGFWHEYEVTDKIHDIGEYP